MKHPLLVTGFFLALSALPIAARAADVANVRIEVNGKTYSGQLAAEAPTGAGAGPTTSPASTPTTPPATRPTESAASLSGMAPFQVHLDAGDVVSADAVRDARVQWNFGDPAGRFNSLSGFNAAHIYDAAGNYVVTRTIHTPAGDSVKRWSVEVRPSSRHVTYVSLDGDDHNDGRTPEHAVRSFDRGVLGTNGGAGDVLFRRGDRFSVTRALTLRYDDCRLGAFGDSALARPLLFNIGSIGSPMMIDAGGKRLIVEDLAFDAPKAKPFDKAGTLDVLIARGQGLAVRRCTVLNVDDLVNGNGVPNGVLIEDCDAPLDTGLRAYFAWVQGANWTLLGNHVANSTREHIVRVGGADRLNIQFNDFTNLDRHHAATQPDSTDDAKGVLNVQKGSMLYVANNLLTGPSGVGPLGKQDGLADKAGRFVGAVVENNRITGILEVKHGASHITYRDNFLRADDTAAFAVDGFSKDYNRGVVDLRLERNTVVNAGKTGSFLTMWGGAKEVAVVGNVYVAPALVIGEHDSAALCVLEPDLRAFTTISGNVWPVARPSGFAHNGIHYFSWKLGEAGGYLDAAAWAKLPQVSGDRVEAVGVADWQKVKQAGADASALPSQNPAASAPNKE